MKHSLIIPVQAMDRTGLSLACEEKPEAFPVVEELIRNGELVCDTPITIAAEVERVQDLIRATGTAKTSIRLLCSRCLNKFQASMSAEFSFVFSREAPKRDDKADKSEKELSTDEIGLVYYQGEHVDLRESIQEQLVMALPQRPLCRGSCKGLCPQCGKDMNQGDCGCRQPVLDDRMAALKHLKIVSEDE